MGAYATVLAVRLLELESISEFHKTPKCCQFFACLIISIKLGDSGRCRSVFRGMPITDSGMIPIS